MKKNLIFIFLFINSFLSAKILKKDVYCSDLYNLSVWFLLDDQNYLQVKGFDGELVLGLGGISSVNDFNVKGDLLVFSQIGKPTQDINIDNLIGIALDTKQMGQE